ncbi:MAG: DUF21 domain-containing protein [Armatimonadia bacterium]|nr:DUF21 domain-containing protein [Armatimonadia bacterium]
MVQADPECVEPLGGWGGRLVAGEEREGPVEILHAIGIEDQAGRLPVRAHLMGLGLVHQEAAGARAPEVHALVARTIEDLHITLAGAQPHPGRGHPGEGRPYLLLARGGHDLVDLAHQLAEVRMAVDVDAGRLRCGRGSHDLSTIPSGRSQPMSTSASSPRGRPSGSAPPCCAPARLPGGPERRGGKGTRYHLIDGTQPMQILALAGLVILNGLFAMAELAIFTSRRGRLQQRAAEGSGAAQAVLEMGERPTPYLSTIQVAITLIGVLAGAFGEKAMAADLAKGIAQWQPLAPHASALALAIVVGSITLATLVLGELVPKRLALRRPEGIACAMALPLRFLARAARPVVALLSWLTEAVLWVLRAREGGREEVSAEDVGALLREAAEVGALEEEERDIAQSAVELGEVTVSDILVPRHDVDWIDLTESFEAARDRVLASPHSRLPAARATFDSVVGLIAAKDVLNAALAPEPPPVEELVRPIGVIPEAASALALLEVLRESATPMAAVIDEHGHVEGIATLSEVIARLVEGLAPALGRTEPEITRRADGSYLIDGDAPLDRVEEVVGLPGMADAAPRGVRTLAGLVISLLGHVGAEGEEAEWAGSRLRILEMDGRRIARVALVTPDQSHVTPDAE